MVSITMAVRDSIIDELERAKNRILEGSDVEFEFLNAKITINELMEAFDNEVRLIINSYW